MSYKDLPDNQHGKGITCFLGGSGTGKTTYMVRAIALQSTLSSVAILDVTGDIRKGLDEKGLRYSLVSDTAEFSKLTRSPFFRLIPGCIVVFGPRPKKSKEIAEPIEAFVNALTTSNTKLEFGCYACDEAELLFNGRPPSLFEGAVYIARNRGVAIYLAAKRPTHIPTAVRSCAMRAVVFKLRSDSDARMVEELGPSSLFRGRVQSLKLGRALYYCGQSEGDTLPVIDSRTSPIPWLENETETDDD